MPASNIFQNSAFGPSEVKGLVEAFERICRELKLAEKEDRPLRERVARKIIEFAESKSCDPELIRAFVLAEVQGIYRQTREEPIALARPPDADAESS